jgi:hypothetical protein
MPIGSSTTSRTLYWKTRARRGTAERDHACCAGGSHASRERCGSDLVAAQHAARPLFGRAARGGSPTGERHGRTKARDHRGRLRPQPGGHGGGARAQRLHRRASARRRGALRPDHVGGSGSLPTRRRRASHAPSMRRSAPHCRSPLPLPCVPQSLPPPSATPFETRGSRRVPRGARSPRCTGGIAPARRRRVSARSCALACNIAPTVAPAEVG